MHAVISQTYPHALADAAMSRGEKPLSAKALLSLAQQQAGVLRSQDASMVVAPQGKNDRLVSNFLRCALRAFHPKRATLDFKKGHMDALGWGLRGSPALFPLPRWGIVLDDIPRERR
jgi:hypothetical protein